MAWRAAAGCISVVLACLRPAVVGGSDPAAAADAVGPSPPLPLGGLSREALLAWARSGQPPPELWAEVLRLEEQGGRHERDGAEGWRPQVVPQWSAALCYDGGFMGIGFTGCQGRFIYDGPGQRNRMTVNSTSDYFTPNETHRHDQLTLAHSGGSSQNMTMGSGPDDEVCMPFPAPYHDLFGWVKLARFTGRKVVGGEPCKEWSFHVPGFGADFSMCLAEDGVPREFNQSINAGKFSMTSYMQFYSVTVGAPEERALDPSWGCAHNYPTQPCADEGVSLLDTYRIWGLPEPLELQNRNTGDVLGDLSFVCTQGSSAAYRSKLITHWKVNVSRAFGQYAMCNYDGKRNACNGPPDMLSRVGRRSGQMQGKGKLMGQCSENDDVGSQFSFPEEAMCAPGVDPSAHQGCAWGGAVPVRTVEASCIMEDRGLLEACKHEIGHAPFVHAARIWEAAFASEDPSKGGCPEAPVSRSSVVVI